MSAFFFTLHKDQSVNSLLFILINPENQYATNSLILISYLKGKKVQNKNTQGWHSSLLYLCKAVTKNRHLCSWLPW